MSVRKFLQVCADSQEYQTANYEEEIPWGHGRDTAQPLWCPMMNVSYLNMVNISKPTMVVSNAILVAIGGQCLSFELANQIYTKNIPE